MLSLHYLFQQKSINKTFKATMNNFNFLNFLRGEKYCPTANNKKETKGRLARKQYVPRYTLDVKKREELIKQWKKDGVSSIEIARRLRQKKCVLHATA